MQNNDDEKIRSGWHYVYQKQIKIMISSGYASSQNRKKSLALTEKGNV
jgi:hypothetical protein